MEVHIWLDRLEMESGWLADTAITGLLTNQSLKSLSAFFVSRDFGLFQSHRALIL